VVEVTSPASGASFRRTLRMAASAKDDQRVARVDFYVDRKLVDRDTTAPYRENWRVRNLGYGTHTVTAKAYDSAGQADADAVSVRRVRGGVEAKSKGRGAKRKTGRRR
jgi:leucyl aminopeptidase